MERKISIVGKKVTFAEAENEDIDFWAERTWKERVAEAQRLRRMIWTHLLGSFPERMRKTGQVIKWSTIDK